MEGDTTNFYISRKLEGTGVKLSIIARGISVGDELEYTDEVTSWPFNPKPYTIRWKKSVRFLKSFSTVFWPWP